MNNSNTVFEQLLILLSKYHSALGVLSTIIIIMHLFNDVLSSTSWLTAIKVFVTG